MESDTILNIIGLVDGVIGGILLFKFGLPENINIKGHINLILEQINEEEGKNAKRYDFLGKLGLIFVIIGFISSL